MNDQFTPDEMKVIEQLKSPPRPKINPARARAIQEQVISEFRNLPQSPAAPHTFSLQVAAALVAAAAVVVILISQIGNQPANTGEASVTSTSNGVAVLPSATQTTNIETTSQTQEPAVTPSETVVASAAIVTSTPVTETPTPTAAPATITLEPLILIEGQVISISSNSININGFTVEVSSDHPILKIIDVGDVIHVEGSLSGSDVIIPSVISNIDDTTNPGSPVTVGLDGPVEAIKDNIVTVNGIPVQFKPDDPILKTLQIGNFVSVQGNFSGSGTTIVLVVVNITVVNNVIIDGNPYCWYHADAMGMGHWHCDGMGMGMGMGDDGMGMGEPAMGMSR